jgi:hypothetical protein
MVERMASGRGQDTVYTFYLQGAQLLQPTEGAEVQRIHFPPGTEIVTNGEVPEVGELAHTGHVDDREAGYLHGQVGQAPPSCLSQVFEDDTL